MDRNSRTLSAVLGGSPELALFEAFAFRSDTPISPVQASRFSGVAWATAHRKILDWESNGVLSCVGKDKKSNLYVLNSNSETVRILAKAVRTAVIELFESESDEIPALVDEVECRPSQQIFEMTGEIDKLNWNKNELKCKVYAVPSGF
jgi:hypothetical protein